MLSVGRLLPATAFQLASSSTYHTLRDSAPVLLFSRASKLVLPGAAIPLLLLLPPQKEGNPQSNDGGDRMTAAAQAQPDSGLEQQLVTAAPPQQQAEQQQQQAKKQRWTPQQEHFMSLAFEQAHLALKVREVPIGCVVVRDGQVVGTGYNLTNHTRNATRHAELEVIDRILADKGGDIGKADFGSCELYVTIEPCIMCAGALSLMGFKHVYFGAANDKFGGCGSILTVHQDGCGCCSGRPSSSRPAQPFTAVGGLFADEAIRLLQTFYTAGNPAAPKPHRAVMEVPPWEQNGAAAGAHLQRPGQHQEQQQPHQHAQQQQQQHAQQQQANLPPMKQQQQQPPPSVGWDVAGQAAQRQFGADAGNDALHQQYAA